jgi:hypothetical protein
MKTDVAAVTRWEHPEPVSRTAFRGPAKPNEALADRQNFRIIGWYEDHGLTGTRLRKREPLLATFRPCLGHV